jgi:predicted  nucleic acid-binding Zn-ribbon protein
MNRAFKLFRLQQVDSQLDQVRDRLAEIEQELREDQVIKEAVQANELAAAHAQTTDKDLRRAEENTKAQQTKIEANQASLYSGKVTNPKELQDLQSEAEALGRHLRSLEEIQLEKMAANEEAAIALKSAQDNLEAVKAQRSVENSALTLEQAKLTHEAERIENERTPAAHGISDEDLAEYQTLRQAKNRLAVARTQNKTCSACGTQLSESLAQAARSPNELARCSTCKRILYAG